MRTSPYSEDLRGKVIEYIKQGKSQQLASKIFGIHKNTINRWWIRYKNEGSYSPRIRLGLKSKVDKNELEEFVRNNPSATLSTIGLKFGISAWQVGRILKKLGFRYKKSLYLCGGE